MYNVISRFFGGNIYSVCVFLDLDIQHAMHMHHIFISDLSDCKKCCALSYKRQYFREKKLLQ